ncbi:MAG: T9SS type A sorting domain-containing protein [Ignavibacteria bacterium]|nr:T9SS type A sorting domain-containing protein [Ignavibacteria bacterium]
MRKLILSISLCFSINLFAQNISVSKDTMEFFDFWDDNKSADSITIFNNDNHILILDSITSQNYMFRLQISYNDSIVNEYLMFYQDMTPLSFEIPANDSAKLIFDLFVIMPKLSHFTDIWNDTISIFNNSINNSTQNIAVLSDITLGNEDENNIPIKYELFQNYPNPFNPNTQIKYSIPESEYVEIIIYDILGDEVKSLVSEYKAAGKYKIEFNANNLSSGIYFYRIICGRFSETRKMLLLR